MHDEEVRVQKRCGHDARKDQQSRSQGTKQVHIKQE